MRNNKTAELVLTALFAAIIIIMAFTPLGYIPLVVINATIIHIPVILGALFCGPKKGGFLGFIFGLTSFIKNTVMPTSLSAFVFSPVLAAPRGWCASWARGRRRGSTKSLPGNAVFALPPWRD